MRSKAPVNAPSGDLALVGSIKGNPKRQEVLAEALAWVSSSQSMTVDAYLALHRQDSEITQLKAYFTSVIDWIGTVFTRSPDREMRGLEWGKLYETYHSKSYNPVVINEEVAALRADPAVTSKKGIYEYLLGRMGSPASPVILECGV